MDMELPESGKRGVTTQHVFELLPAIPLYSPGSLPPTPLHRHFQEKQELVGTRDSKPLPTTHEVLSSSKPVKSDTPAWERLIRHTLLPHEIISLIEAIFTSKEEVKMLSDLRGDDAQTFINVIHEVSFVPLPSKIAI